MEIPRATKCVFNGSEAGILHVLTEGKEWALIFCPDDKIRPGHAFVALREIVFPETFDTILLELRVNEN